MSGKAQAAVTYNSAATGNWLRVMHILADCADINLRVNPAPKQESLAAIIGVSVRQIRRIIQHLIDSGELVQERRGRKGMPSIYRINLPTTRPFEDISTGHNGTSQQDTGTGDSAANNAQQDTENDSTGQGSGVYVRLEAQIANLADMVVAQQDTIKSQQDKIEVILSAWQNLNRTSTGHDPAVNLHTILFDPKDIKEYPPNPPRGESEWGGDSAENPQPEEPAQTNDPDPLEELVQFFSDSTGITAPSNLKAKQTRETWLEPLIAIYKATGDYAATETLITQAIAEMDGKKLTISKPQSIQATALSIHRRPSAAIQATTSQQNGWHRQDTQAGWAAMTDDQFDELEAAIAAGM